MSLKNILDMSESDINQLEPFVKDNVIYISVHPCWSVFYGELKKFKPLDISSIPNHFIDRLIKGMLQNTEKIKRGGGHGSFSI